MYTLNIDFDCLFRGKCVEYDYECTFTYNGEEFLTDNCFSNIYGYSYCMLDDVKYRNVSYNCKTINEKVVQRAPILSSLIFPFSLGIFSIIFCILSFLLRKALYSKRCK